MIPYTGASNIVFFWHMCQCVVFYADIELRRALTRALFISNLLINFSSDFYFNVLVEIEPFYLWLGGNHNQSQLISTSFQACAKLKIERLV